VFTTFYREHHQVAFQQEVIGSEEKEVEKFFFTTTQYASLSWIEEGLEFEWHDKMYDVYKIVKTTNGYWVYCENDGFEELLISVLKSLKKDMDGGLQNLNPQPQFYQTIETYSPSSINSFHKKTLNVGYFTSYKSISSSIPSPPPKS
jgi:hypothetical protein